MSLLVRTCWLYTDRLSADHTVLSSHVTLTYNKYCWSTAAASGTPAEDMAAKAGWICSAGSSGSASSLRSIRCVRALSQYTPSPDLLSREAAVEQQVIDCLVGFNHVNYDNYRSVANGCLLLITDNWLITSARCHCGCPIHWHIHKEMSPDFFRKFTGNTVHVRVPKQS